MIVLWRKINAILIQLLQASTPTTHCSKEPRPSSEMREFTASLFQPYFLTWWPSFLWLLHTLLQIIYFQPTSTLLKLIMHAPNSDKPGLSITSSSFPKCSPTGSESFIPITTTKLNLIYPTAAQPDAAAPKNLSTASPRSSAASTLASSLPPRQKNLSLPLNGF